MLCWRVFMHCLALGVVVAVITIVVVVGAIASGIRGLRSDVRARQRRMQRAIASQTPAALRYGRNWRWARSNKVRGAALRAAGAYGTVVMTYGQLDAIPRRIYDGLDRWAPRHRVLFFNDQDCKDLLRRHCGPEAVRRFQAMSNGAHRADLFRYALLAHSPEPVIYLDVKTVLAAPLDALFPDVDCAHTVLSATPDTIYQGILASSPRNPVVLAALRHALTCPLRDVNASLFGGTYTVFTAFFRQALLRHGIDLSVGATTQGWALWREVLSADGDDGVCGGLDRYGFCSTIRDADDNVVFLTRDRGFGRTW